MSFTVTATETQKYQLYILATEMCPQKTDTGDSEGGIFLAREEEWKTQIDLVENQRGRLEGKIRGRPPCSFTDVHFQTPQTQSESSRH